jgi:16S rRNA (guanine527-N7)-methyltransferase
MTEGKHDRAESAHDGNDEGGAEVRRPSPLAALVERRFDELLAVLGDAARLGFVGDDPRAAVRHADGFRAMAGIEAGGRVLDLGSGGGLPGLVLAVGLEAAEVTLLDAREGRTDFLRRAVRKLGLGDRVEIVTGEAQVVAHRVDRRGRYDAVVSRSFGSPAVTAECAAGFLRVGGRLVVSEPPGDGGAADRWPEAGLAVVGQRLLQVGEGYVAIEQVASCPPRYPRRSLRPPLF